MNVASKNCVGLSSTWLQVPVVSCFFDDPFFSVLGNESVSAMRLSVVLQHQDKRQFGVPSSVLRTVFFVSAVHTLDVDTSF